MFTIIYEKSDGKVLSITTKDNEEELKKSISESKDFIFAENLPTTKQFRQVLKVKNKTLIVEDLQLTKEQEKNVIYLETQIEIDKYKKLLEETDYKALKFIDGEFTEEEYAPIREERKSYRVKINELEDKLKNI